ncbi:hypothetical protein [Pedobacter sp. GR22-6]|uniref:hypothetical protein n=1 Tax=Pedobacter sp. GR22-6 TaxID=3127957 RepID=UPI00307EDB4B
MQVKLHRHYRIAAYLVFFSSVMILGNYLLHQGKSIGNNPTFGLESALLMAIIGYFIMLGKDWSKFVLSFIATISLFSLVNLSGEFEHFPLFVILNVTSIAAQLLADVFLFMVPKSQQ